MGAFLALRFERFLSAGADARAFEEIVVNPFRELIERHNLLLLWLKGAWRWPFRKLVDRTFSRTKAAAELLGDIFLDGASCNDLPDHPLLVLNATSQQSMRAWRFTKWGMGDSRVGHTIWGTNPLPLGVCVGASAAFPPVFPPVRIDRRQYSFSGPIYDEQPLPVYPFIPLTDGGVYDNMGVEALIKATRVPGQPEAIEPATVFVVSDGGASPNLHLRESGIPAVSETFLLYRVDEIAREQVTALRARAIVGELIQKKRQGLFVSLRSDVNRIGPDLYKAYCTRVDPVYLLPGPLVELVRTVRTSLDRFDRIELTALMYHAYMMTDAFLWCYRDSFSPEFKITDQQVPDWRIRFTPEVTREWTDKLSTSASVRSLR